LKHHHYKKLQALFQVQNHSDKCKTNLYEKLKDISEEENSEDEGQEENKEVEEEEKRLLSKIDKEKCYQEYYKSEFKKLASVIDLIYMNITTEDNIRRKYENKINKLSLQVRIKK